MILSSRLSFCTVIPVGRTPKIATRANATTARLNAISTIVNPAKPRHGVPPRYGVPPLGGRARYGVPPLGGRAVERAETTNLLKDRLKVGLHENRRKLILLFLS